MPILTPGPQCEPELRLVRADNHAIAIVGTAERMCVCYPIAVTENDDGSFGWDYTGGEPREYDETAEVETDARGEPLFQDADGNDVPASQVAILTEEGEEVGRLGAPVPAPAPPPPGGAVLRLPYELDPTTDDASILAHVERWLEGQPAARRSLTEYLVTTLKQEA